MKVDLPLQDLEGCETYCLKVFEKLQELKGKKDKTPVFQMEEFQKVAAHVRTTHPEAENKDILCSILKKFAQTLRAA